MSETDTRLVTEIAAANATLAVAIADIAALRVQLNGMGSGGRGRGRGDDEVPTSTTQGVEAKQQHPAQSACLTTHIFVPPADMISTIGITESRTPGRRQIVPPMQLELTTKREVRRTSPF